MFYRNGKRRLCFNNLDFEIFIADIIEYIKPDNADDLKWMIGKMIDSIQLCAWEYVNDSDDFNEEWEDVAYVDYL